MPPELIELSKAFIRLQDERHDADYDLSLTYSRNEADAIVSLAEQAFKDWTAVRTTPAAAIFLACFQLKKAWDTER